MSTVKQLNKNEIRVGYYSSLLLAVITLITFGFAITAVPVSGAFCPENCVDYPYLDTLKQFPKDFIWMYLAVVLNLVYVVYMISIHFYASEEKKIFSQIGLIISIMSALILIVNYFIQSSVIPASLKSGETEGIPLLIQYNSHGLFIAMEELGFILASLSFLFMAIVFGNENRLVFSIKWIFLIAFVLTVLSFVYVSFRHGIVRDDYFEITVISIVWLVFIINGILASIVFRRLMNRSQ
jgi:hypothetical protein